MTIKPNETKIIVLGGLGEVGKNMYCVMHGDEIIIIDAGIRFPEGELLGVDYVLPDYTFLKENESKIKALVITHGHEDHIGGIPFLLQTVNIPMIYAPKQAKELIALKLEDRNISILDAIIKCNMAPSKGQARTLINQGGISLNDEKVTDTNYTLSDSDFKDGYAILKKGKKVFNKLV